MFGFEKSKLLCPPRTRCWDVRLFWSAKDAHIPYASRSDWSHSQTHAFAWSRGMNLRRH